MHADSGKKIASQHLLGASSIEIRGNHAIAETRISILIRLPVHGIEADVSAIARFYDHLQCSEQEWRIKRRFTIFDKDMIWPSNPAEALAINQEQFLSYPASYRCCGYVLAQRGMEINQNLPAPNSASLAALYGEGEVWLNGI